MGPSNNELIVPSSQRPIQWRFIAFSSLFFVASTMIFILTFSALRVNDLRAEQAVTASTYLYELESIIENVDEEILDNMLTSYLGTLVNDRAFICIRIDIAWLNTTHAWPTNYCHEDLKNKQTDIHISGARADDTANKFLIHATLDEGAPFDTYLQEANRVALSAFLMGLFTLFAVNFAFNRSVRGPLKQLLDELLEALAGADGSSWSNDHNSSRISRFSGAYNAMLERAKELRRKEAFWRTITDSSHDCVISIDRQGRIIDFNVEAENTFGHPREAVIGLQLSNLIVPSRHLELWDNQFHSQEDKSYSETQETELLRADGREFPAEYTIREITIEDEQFFTIYLWDVSYIFERERELREARNNAEEASTAKSSFLAMMSHEIRTPLNAVHGALGLIGSSKLDSSQEKFLTVGKKGAESLLLIINDILDFSRVEAGKLVLEPALFDPAKTVEDVLQVLEPRVLEKEISLTHGPGCGSSEYLIGDASRIRQVLLNLCSNAVRFTDQGNVHVDYSCIYSKDDNVWLRFVVTDTGRGVSADDQEHLFEEFWGQNNSGAFSNRGTGLGLPISKKLVEVMGGSIGFESKLGQGSTFWFELPLQSSGEEILAEKNTPDKLDQKIADKTLTALQGRVLLAEDNPANQLISQAMLERMGLQVDIAANGHEVIDAIHNCPYDLILMDVNMPEMDGIEATRVIRELPDELSSIPIIAMTALAMPGDKTMLLSKGMDDYVSKPVIQEALHASIVRTLKAIKSTDSDLPNTKNADLDNKEPALIDTEVVNLLGTNVGPELLPQIINIYLSEVPARVNAITRAASLGDFALVAKEAHPLKSSSASIGAMQLADLASTLESAGREQDLEIIEKHINYLANLSDRTQTALLNLITPPTVSN